MVPEPYILAGAVLEGTKRLRDSDLPFVYVQHIRVKTDPGEKIVTALVANNPSRPHARTFMFFCNQTVNEQGGTASFFTIELLGGEEIVDTRNHGDASSLSWTDPTT